MTWINFNKFINCRWHYSRSHTTLPSITTSTKQKH